MHTAGDNPGRMRLIRTSIIVAVVLVAVLMISYIAYIAEVEPIQLIELPIELLGAGGLMVAGSRFLAPESGTLEIE